MGFLIELHGDPNLNVPSRRAATRVAQIFSDFFRVIRELEANRREDAAINLAAIQNHLELSIREYESFAGKADPRNLLIPERIVASVPHLRTFMESSDTFALAGVDGEVRRKLDDFINTISGKITTHLSLVELSVGLLRAMITLVNAMRERGLEPVQAARAILTTVFVIQILMTNIASISAESGPT